MNIARFFFVGGNRHEMYAGSKKHIHHNLNQ